MADNENMMNEAVEGMRNAAESIRRSDPSLGGEMDLLASNLESQAPGPPSPSTSEFDISGDEVTFPDTAPTGVEILERIIDENDMLPASFLEQGAVVQRGVARVMLKKAYQGLPAGNGWGTSFLVSPSLLMTNNHVIPDIKMAKRVRIQFNYQLASDGLDKMSDVYETDPVGLFQTNKALDYTLIKVRSKQFSNHPEMGTGVFPPGNRWGYLELHDSPIYRKGAHCNVIQHPSGRKKEIALQKNEINRLFENVVRYQADTEPGSSGSPVLDNVWQLLALHHAGGSRDSRGKWLDNEGIRIDRIVDDLRNVFEASRPDVISELGI